MTGRPHRRGRGTRLRLLATVCAAAAGLAACTGVPASSAPETIQPVPRVNQQPAGFTPRTGEAPRQIVNDFLHDNSVDPRQHSAARLYLTAAARNRWTDTTATIISDERVGTYQVTKNQVVVTGRIVGKLDADGVYTPYLQAAGGTNQGGQAVFVFGLQRVHGEYRISDPTRGLLLTADQFEQSYRPKPLYFFDLSNRYLVPDQRWSALQGVPLEEWLVGELANGPSDLLQSAVNSDTMPAQANTSHFVVSGGNPTKIEIPGAGQLEGAARNRLAAQVGTTLNDVLPGETFVITDGGRPVPIPASGSPEFAESSFGRAQGPAPPTADVYYLRGGRIVKDGLPIPGRVNNGAYFFTSVALTRITPTSPLTVAAVADGHQLLVGSQFGGLVKTAVHGELSRPAWAPGWGEVWIGDGDKIYRVLAAHPDRQPLEVPLPPEDVGAGRVVALQLSAEGTRLAVIIEGANGSRRLYVGAVTRSGGKVRVDTLDQVSPLGVSVDDVDWIEPLALVAIGEHRGDARIFTVNVDGSMWTETSVSGLPARPNYVTVTPGQQVWVSVGSGASSTVWEQENTETWQSPGPVGQTPGTAPQYLE
ncbi:MAG TPA: LpqB family beta-propeller domain-containing protein [Jatrophihabitans sp.]|nr:LpqB family beta-propeller domain-containing protein [Jatrophihabitans sp.]